MKKSNKSYTLTEFQVNQIRMHLESGMPQKKIAKIFHISQAHVSMIKNDKRWANHRQLSLF